MKQLLAFSLLPYWLNFVLRTIFMFYAWYPQMLLLLAACIVAQVMLRDAL